MEKQVIELCVANWKSQEIILELMSFVPSEQMKLMSSRFAFEQRQFQRFLLSNDISLVSYTNQLYAVNLPVTVVNNHEMEPTCSYVIIKTLEPTVVLHDQVLQWGSVMVKKL